MMKKLNQTWKHQKPFNARGNSSDQKEAPLGPAEASTKRRFLGRIQVDSKITSAASCKEVTALESPEESKASNQCQDISFGCSFGGELDDNFLNAMENIEKNYQEEKKSSDDKNQPALEGLDLNLSGMCTPKFVSTPSVSSECVQKRRRKDKNNAENIETSSFTSINSTLNHNAPKEHYDNRVRCDNEKRDGKEVRYNTPASTDELPSASRRSLSSWGLPDTVMERYKQKGITELFAWQVECLCTGRALDGGNLVYSAPTSAGKTMVAELLMLKRFFETKRKAIFILPFVSVVREKVHYLQELFQDAGIRVEGFMGGQNPAGGFKMVDIAICTIEKANSLVNRIMEENEISQLGCLVVDELHMVGDSHRGYLLELLLTKVRYLSQQAVGNESHVQLIGMSATLPNLPLLAKWLNADLYHTDYRPVPLTEMIKIGNSLYDNSLAVLRPFTPLTGLTGDEDHVISLCLETIQEGHSVLIFCPTKNWCEKLADTIAREFFNLCKSAQDVKGAIPVVLDSLKLQEVIEQLKRSPVGLDKVLGRMIPMGVAYHHAGLTFDERDVIEGGFRRGALRVLVATSTLSSGVNLPARRVIIRTPTFHGDVIDTLTYKQMAGRAGRKGVDTAGESILVCKTSEKNRAMKLVTSDLPPVHSCLASLGSLSGSMKRAILEVVVSGVAATSESVHRYAQCTLLSASMESEEGCGNESIEECIKFLLDSEFIALQGNSDEGEMVRYDATPLGSAVLSSALAPDEGLTVFAELQKARRCFVLENDLHIVYIVTPIYMCNSLGVIDWFQYLCMWESLSPGFRSVSDLVGVKECFLSRAVQGRLPTKTSERMRTLQVHKRFYTAMALHDLVSEVPLTEVAAKYKCPKGTLQSLQQAAATFAGMITVFCRRLGWHHMAILLEDFQSRLTFGVQRELVDLVRLSLLTGFRARMLFDSGLQTVAQVASAETRDVEKVLAKAVPFQSKKKFEGDTEWEANQRQRKALCGILGPGGQALTDAEAAQLVIEEAQRLMTADLAQLGVQWNGPAITCKTTKTTQRRKSKGSNGKKRRSTGKKRSPVKKKSPACSIRAPPSPPPPPDSEVLFSEPLIDDSIPNPESEQNSVRLDATESPQRDSAENKIETTKEAEFTGGSSVLDAEASDLLAQLTPGPWQPKSEDTSPALFLDEMDSTCDFMREFSTQQALIEHSASPVLKRTEVRLPEEPDKDISAGAMSEDVLFAEDFDADKRNDAINDDSFTSSVMDEVFNCDISLETKDISLETKDISPKPSKETAALIDTILDDTKRTPKTVPKRAKKKRRSAGGDDVVRTCSPPKQSCVQNTSDCVPPTPPKEFTPQKLIGVANGTPTRVLRSAKKEKDHVVATQESFTIIDVAAHKELFKQFVKEWRSQTHFSLSVACDRLPTNAVIGANFNSKDSPPPAKGGDLLICRGVLIHGVAVSWENRDAYYISLSSALSDTDLDPDDSMAAPPLDPSVPLKQRLSAVKLCLQSTSSAVTCFDVKSTLCFLSIGCGVIAKGSFMDPKVADWMLDPASRIKNLHRMIKTYAPDEMHLLEGLGGGIGQSSMGLSPENPGSGRFRACTESILVRKVMSPLSLLLAEAGLKKAFVDIEMPTVALLSKMELNGMGFSQKESESQRNLLQAKLSSLEQQAYQLSRHPFQLTAPAEVAQVLYVELKLPPSGDPANPSATKTLGVRKSSRGRKPAFSTSKETLDRLRPLHPLPGVILEWRRLTSALSKVVFPLQRAAVYNDRLGMRRIHGECDTHSATGRVSMHEPSLQMIPNDFDIEGFEDASCSRLQTSSPVSLSMRHAFIPFTGGVLLTADYSQLELRMIAHLAQDKKLIRVLNGGGDVFKIIASQWKGVEVEEVTAGQRQQTKQICYGMIYGIGAKALAEQLGIGEEDAAVFCESFKAKFTGMRTYLRETVQKCRENGYVQTLSGRRRYLPAIHETNGYARAHAERQAVNTTVQGSAADLVKAAMLKADRKLTALFPQSRFPHLHSQDPLRGRRNTRRSSSSALPPPQGAYFILQLHDELIYEVNADHLTHVATVVKDSMETALTLDVKFPVKVKVGQSWGSLEDYEVK